MTKNRFGKVLLTGMAFSLIAATPLRNALTFQPESRIWVSGKSSVKDWKCAAKTINATIAAPSENGSTAPLAKLVAAGEISVPVALLECGNGTMNDHMRKALKAKEFPNLVFKMSSYTITDEDITVNGTMTIAGKDLRVELTGKVSEKDGVVRSTATKDIDMTQWGVKPPSLMLGTMKVKPVVTIAYDISLKR